MAQILSLAQSFGMSPEPPSDHGPSAPPKQEQKVGMPDEGFLQAIMGLMQQARQSDSKQEALLCALKPYLAPDRRDKIDRALEIARISHLAGFALRNYGKLPGK
ncbi:MAG: hypothetical protein ACI3VQ_07775 [Faecousia sp.]